MAKISGFDTLKNIKGNELLTGLDETSDNINIEVDDLKEFVVKEVRGNLETTTKNLETTDKNIGRIDTSIDYEDVGTNGLSYHVKDKQAVHSNFMEDSIYPIDTKDGIWCGEKYNNEPFNYPLVPHSTAVLTSNLIVNGFSINVKQTGSDGWISQVVGTAEFDRYVSYKENVRSGSITWKTSPNNSILTPEFNNGRYQIKLLAGYELYFAQTIFDADLYDFMITTIPNAPYVKHQQQASNVKIDTSKWNKEIGSFSFDMESLIASNGYAFDWRKSSDPTIGIAIDREKSDAHPRIWAKGIVQGHLDDTGRICITWEGTTLRVYQNGILRHTITEVAYIKDLDSTASVGSRFSVERWANTYISNIAYRESIELPTKPFIDPRFNLYANGGFQDHLGNWNNEVYYQRKVDKGLDTEVLIIGEDIPLLNGWTAVSPDYAPTITRIGRICYMTGLVKGGTSHLLAELPLRMTPQLLCQFATPCINDAPHSVNFLVEIYFTRAINVYTPTTPYSYRNVSCSWTIGE